jgi:hypothetical protein
MQVDLALYTNALAWYGVLMAALVGLMSGLLLGAWLVIRFCDVQRTERP